LIDLVDAATRSRMMSGIKGKHTKPELVVRRFLHASGFRFRLHRKELPGRPDLVLPKYRLAIFVHGCFWHRHADCFYSTIPKSRVNFWQGKLEGNAVRDALHIASLLESGWRVMVVWECGLKHSPYNMGELLDFILGEGALLEWPIVPPRLKLV
jgi:DNA mismatch endonuclease (patch repair protein)